MIIQNFLSIIQRFLVLSSVSKVLSSNKDDKIPKRMYIVLSKKKKKKKKDNIT